MDAGGGFLLAGSGLLRGRAGRWPDRRVGWAPGSTVPEAFGCSSGWVGPADQPESGRACSRVRALVITWVQGQWRARRRMRWRPVVTRRAAAESSRRRSFGVPSDELGRSRPAWASRPAGPGRAERSPARAGCSRRGAGGGCAGRCRGRCGCGPRRGHAGGPRSGHGVVGRVGGLARVLINAAVHGDSAAAQKAVHRAMFSTRIMRRRLVRAAVRSASAVVRRSRRAVFSAVACRS